MTNGSRHTDEQNGSIFWSEQINSKKNVCEKQHQAHKEYHSSHLNKSEHIDQSIELQKMIRNFLYEIAHLCKIIHNSRNSMISYNRKNQDVQVQGRKKNIAYVCHFITYSVIMTDLLTDSLVMAGLAAAFTCDDDCFYIANYQTLPKWNSTSTDADI